LISNLGFKDRDPASIVVLRFRKSEWQAMADAVFERTDLLRKWIGNRVSSENLAWFDNQIAQVKESGANKALYLALGYAPRRLGKRDLNLSDDEFAAAQSLRPGWDPRDWSIDQAARLAFILASFGSARTRLQTELEQLFRTADVGELIAFYRGLPLYPAPETHLARAREGARSAMQPVFEAVAHRNPYPREQFDENAWNHMVLKALFIGSRLDPIQGLDARANLALMRMLCDYAHERWAAGRPVTPELWRCVGPFADRAALADLDRVLTIGNSVERQAAALALSASPNPGAVDLLQTKAPDLAKTAAAGKPGWAALSMTAQ
jgi:hypothetical protein